MIRPADQEIARATSGAPATPTGGARPQGWGRGRGFGPFAISALSLLLLAAPPVRALDAVEVPSGQDVVLSEVLIDDSPGEIWVRFRFVAPGIAREGGSVGHDAAAGDIDDLCATYALPYLEREGIEAARVVISLADRELPFGSADPEATQYFEAYRPDDGQCIWEGF